MKQHSLTGRTLITFVSFALTIIILLWFFQVHFFHINYEQYQIHTITDSAEKIKNTPLDEIDETLESLAYDNDICAQYISGKEITNYNTRNKNCILENKNINNIKFDIFKNHQQFIKLQGPDGAKAIIYAVDLGNEKYVFFNTTLEDLSIATKLLENQMIYISIFIIALAVILAIFISKQFNKPIISITNKAGEMAKGNYDIKFDDSNVCELTELSNVLSVAASEMKQTDELRRDLLANVSHDLKTPLTMIKAYAEKIRDISYKNDEKRNKDLSVIIDESDRLNGLVNDLVEMSKIDAKKASLNMTKYDLRDEINEVMKRYDLIKEKDGYIINLNLPDKELTVEADRKKLDQVFYNLINNSIEHSGEDKRVDIDVKLRKDIITVKIKNYGKPIKKEEIPLVWTRYYTKEKNHKRNTIGTGIGLSIVKDVFDLHGIKYGVESDEKNGTIFSFVLDKCKK
jgi:signal transduction histidine kinase